MSNQAGAKLRVGVVSYLNMLPLVHGLDRLELEGVGLDVVSVPPSSMAEMMDRAELDLGMVPVGALLERPEWKIVGRSMIGSNGPVKSVLAISSEPPERWTSLHPDSHSRTSNILVQILLANRFGVRPKLLEPVPFDDWEPPSRTLTGEAFLLIGTRALRWRDYADGNGGFVLDLGEAWTEWTGLPFVYAVWASREGLDLRAVRIDEWMQKFEELKSRNLAQLDSILTFSAPFEAERLSIPEAREYLTKNIQFDLDSRALAGLERYAEEGRKLALF